MNFYLNQNQNSSFTVIIINSINKIRFNIKNPIRILKDKKEVYKFLNQDLDKTKNLLSILKFDFKY